VSCGRSGDEWCRVAVEVEDGFGGEEDACGGAVGGAVGAAGEVDGAGVLVDDSLRDPEAEAGAAFSLGGEERLEEAVAVLRGDSRAVVGDFDDGTVFERRG